MTPVSAGVPGIWIEPAVVKVSRWLGHASAAFTLDPCGQVLPDRNEHEDSGPDRRRKCPISW